MTHDHSFTGEITSADDFEAALGELLTQAHENNIEPLGSWVYRNGESAPHWEVMVLELDKDGAKST